MSKFYGKEVTYKCFNDCQMSGCPGHTLKMVEHNGGVYPIIDGEAEYGHTLDLNMLKAMGKSFGYFWNNEEADK